MASTANEVLILFSQALSQPADSTAQLDVLVQVRAAIEQDPSFIPLLYSTILSVAPRAGILLQRWIADVVEFVVARLTVISSTLTPEQRAHCKCISFHAGFYVSCILHSRPSVLPSSFSLLYISVVPVPASEKLDVPSCFREALLHISFVGGTQLSPTR